MFLRAIHKNLAITFAMISLLLLTHKAMAQASPPQLGGTMVMVVQPEPPTLASYTSTAGPVGQVTTKVYEGLLEYDFKLNPQPSLAKSWTVSPDGKVITFKL